MTCSLDSNNTTTRSILMVVTIHNKQVLEHIQCHVVLIATIPQQQEERKEKEFTLVLIVVAIHNKALEHTLDSNNTTTTTRRKEKELTLVLIVVNNIEHIQWRVVLTATIPQQQVS